MVAPAVNHTLTETTLPRLIQSSPYTLPYTPVTSDGFKALRHLVEGETQDLSELSKHRIEKALNAGERAPAKESLLLDENRQLIEQNYEKQIRTSNPSKIVGSAKIMSYEEIVAELLKLDLAAPKAGDQSISISKQQVRASPGISNKRARLTEVERAVREIESSGMQDYCCVFESWCE